MADNAKALPPIYGAAWQCYVSLISQADTKLLKANPTLASGDVLISKDGGATANLATLPTVSPASGRDVLVMFSATEMTAADVVVTFVDASGAEWCDLFLTFKPQVYPSFRTGTAQAGAASTMTLDSGASAVDGDYVGMIAHQTGGTGAGQARRIVSYVGSTKVATVSPAWDTTPSGTILFSLLMDEVASAAMMTRQLAYLDAAVSSRGTSTYAGGAVASVTAAVNVGTIEGTDATDAITAAAEAALASTDTTVGAIAADVTTLLSRLSAARAGYLDNLSAGAVATAAALASVATSVGLTATAAKMLRYVQLTLRKDSAVATDLATELGEINANTGTGTGGYLSTTDSQEASRDAISAGSASAADIAAELGGMGYTVVDADSVTATAISKRRGDVWTITLTDLGALGTWTKLWFTIKTGDTGDADTDAKVQILLTNPTAGTDGLQRLNGAAATAAQGGIVVDDSATGDITVTVASAATTQLAVRSDYVFDVQILRTAGTTTLAYGTFTVRSDVTRAVS